MEEVVGERRDGAFWIVKSSRMMGWTPNEVEILEISILLKKTSTID